MKARRVALTLPPQVLADLSYVALRLGASKSDMVGQFIQLPLAHMRSVLLQYPNPIDRLTDVEKAELRGHFSGLLAAAQADAAGLEASIKGGWRG